MPHKTAQSPRDYHKQIADALNDSFLRKTLDKFAVEYRTSRDAIFGEIDGDSAIRRIADTKDDAAKRLEPPAIYAEIPSQNAYLGARCRRFLRNEEYPGTCR